jgi:hypothetical protein
VQLWRRSSRRWGKEKEAGGLRARWVWMGSSSSSWRGGIGGRRVRVRLGKVVWMKEGALVMVATRAVGALVCQGVRVKEMLLKRVWVRDRGWESSWVERGSRGDIKRSKSRSSSSSRSRRRSRRSRSKRSSQHLLSDLGKLL